MSKFKTRGSWFSLSHILIISFVLSAFSSQASLSVNISSSSSADGVGCNAENPNGSVTFDMTITATGGNEIDYSYTISDVYGNCTDSGNGNDLGTAFETVTMNDLPPGNYTFTTQVDEYDANFALVDSRSVVYSSTVQNGCLQSGYIDAQVFQARTDTACGDLYGEILYNVHGLGFTYSILEVNLYDENSVLQGSEFGESSVFGGLEEGWYTLTGKVVITGSCTNYAYPDSLIDSVSIYLPFDSCNTSSGNAALCNASFTYSVDSNQVDFSNTSSDDSVAYYVWSFGDGATSYDEHPTHIYVLSDTTCDTFEVKLTLYLMNGDTCASEQQLVFCDDNCDVEIIMFDGKLHRGFKKITYLEFGSSEYYAVPHENSNGDNLDTLLYAGVNFTDGTPANTSKVGAYETVTDYIIDNTDCEEIRIYINSSTNVIYIAIYEDGSRDTGIVSTAPPRQDDKYQGYNWAGIFTAVPMPFQPDIVFIGNNFHFNNGAIKAAVTQYGLGVYPSHQKHFIHPNGTHVRQVSTWAELVQHTQNLSTALNRTINIAITGHGSPGAVSAFQANSQLLHLSDPENPTEIFSGFVDAMDGYIASCTWLTCETGFGLQGDMFLQHLANKTDAVMVATTGAQWSSWMVTNDILPFTIVASNNGEAKVIQPSNGFKIVDKKRDPDTIGCDPLTKVRIQFAIRPGFQGFNLTHWNMHGPNTWAFVQTIGDSLIEFDFTGDGTYRIDVTIQNQSGSGLVTTSESEYFRVDEFKHHAKGVVPKLARYEGSNLIINGTAKNPVIAKLWEVTSNNVINPVNPSHLTITNTRFRSAFPDLEIVHWSVEHYVSIDHRPAFVIAEVTDTTCNQTETFKVKINPIKIQLTATPNGPVAPGTNVNLRADIQGFGFEDLSPTYEVFRLSDGKFLRSGILDLNNSQTSHATLKISEDVKVLVYVIVDPIDLSRVESNTLIIKTTQPNPNQGANNLQLMPKVMQNKSRDRFNIGDASGNLPIINDIANIRIQTTIPNVGAITYAPEAIIHSTGYELAFEGAVEGNGVQIVSVNDGGNWIQLGNNEIEMNEMGLTVISTNLYELSDTLPYYHVFKLRNVADRFEYVREYGLIGPEKYSSIEISESNDEYTAFIGDQHMLPGVYYPYAVVLDTLGDTLVRISSPEPVVLSEDISKNYVFDGSLHWRDTLVVHDLTHSVNDFNRFIAQIENPQGEYLGYVDFEYFKEDNLSALPLWEGEPLLRRHFKIDVEHQPIFDRTLLKLYITHDELIELMNANSSINGVNDLRVLKYNGINEDGDITNNDPDSIHYQVLVPESVESIYGGYCINVRVASFSEFWIMGAGSAGGTLPVELLSFEANKHKRTTSQLLWETSLEINSSHFEIERSTNGDDFVQIGEVKAQGNSTDVNRYKWVDNEPVLGSNYYRLKMVDLDGTFSYSNIEMVQFQEDPNNELFEVSPTITDGSLNIGYLGAEEGFKVEISDATGRVLVSEQNVGIQSAMDISRLPASIYYVRCSDSQTQQVIRIIKQ